MFQHRHQPPQHLGGLRLAGDGGDDHRHQRIETYPALLAEVARRRTAAQLFDTAQRLGGVVIADILQQAQRFLVAAALQPQVAQRVVLVRRLVRRRLEHLFEVRFDVAAVAVKGRGKMLPVRKIHRQRQLRAFTVGLGQTVNLLIVQCLQMVFGTAQETVRRFQLRGGMRRQQLQLHQRRQHVQHPALAQTRFTPAAHQLERLDNELDLADTPRPELDVVLLVTALDLAANLALEVTQRVKRLEVQVAAEYERAQQFHQFPPAVLVTGHRARLDHGVALPLAALRLVILFQRVVAAHQRAGAAVGAQAHIHTEHETVGVAFGQRLDQRLPEPGEILLGAERPAPACRTRLRVGKNQIDIGGEIQFTGTQFAHRQHHQRCRLTAIPAQRRRCIRGLPGIQPLQRSLDTGVGQIGQILQRFLERRPAAQVAPGDTQHFALANTPQRLLQCGFVGAGRHRPAHPLRQHAGPGSGQQVATVEQIFNQTRSARTQLGHKPADGEQAAYNPLQRRVTRAARTRRRRRCLVRLPALPCRSAQDIRQIRPGGCLYRFFCFSGHEC